MSSLSPLPLPVDIADALLAGNEGAVLNAVHLYLERGGATFLVDALVRPVMEAVGERWCEGRASVAEEHAASELMRELLTPLLPSLARQRGGPRAVVTCAPGERHLLGARLVAQVLALDGWHVRFLGADTPARELALFVAREQPLFVGLSVSLPENLPGARLALELMHRTTPHIPLMVGGRVAIALLPEEPGAWTRVASTEELLTLTRSEPGGHVLQR